MRTCNTSVGFDSTTMFLFDGIALFYMFHRSVAAGKREMSQRGRNQTLHLGMLSWLLGLSSLVVVQFNNTPSPLLFLFFSVCFPPTTLIFLTWSTTVYCLRSLFFLPETQYRIFFISFKMYNCSFLWFLTIPQVVYICNDFQNGYNRRYSSVSNPRLLMTDGENLSGRPR